MEEADLNRMIEQAKESDRLARERLIEIHKGQVAAVAGSICGRPLDWNNDDELSIGLIAFNEAIDSFDPAKGKSFWNYARMVIHRRLVDYFRKESGWKQRFLIPLENDTVLAQKEAEQALDTLRRREEAREQAEMVASYKAALAEFKISLQDLGRNSPKHQDTKLNLMKIALKIKQNPDLLQKLMETRQLPVKELMLLTGQSRKVLESGRRYLIALILILTRPEFAALRSFIKFPEIQEEGR